MPPLSDLETLLTFLAGSPEYDDMRIRNGEKMVLNALNKAGKKKKGSNQGNQDLKIRFPIKGKVTTLGDKLNILAQVLHLRFNPTLVFPCIPPRLC